MPTRSASYSLARVKLTCCWAAAPCAMAIAPCIASPLPPAMAPIRIAASIAAVDAMLCLPCALHGARDVALRDVRDLVRQHARELGLVAGREHEAVRSRR